jgi:hypothetical protein
MAGVLNHAPCGNLQKSIADSTVRSKRSAAFVAVMFVVISAQACGGPTTPCVDKEGRGNNFPLEIALNCAASGSNLRCAVQPFYGSYSYCPQPLPAVSWISSDTSVASVSADGYVTVVARGEVDITVTAASSYLAPKTWSAVVDPQQPPQQLYWLSGIVRENDGSDTRIPGVSVEILDSYNVGRASIPSNSFGYYRIDRVLINVTFTVRASKPGYIPSTTTYRLGGPNSVGGPPFLDFRLSRSTQ